MGYCDDTNKPRYFISFFGIDNYFRSYIYEDGWSQCSTLYLGVDNLNIILNRVNINGYEWLNCNNTLPFVNCRFLLSSIPLDSDIKKILKNNIELDNIIW